MKFGMGARLPKNPPSPSEEAAHAERMVRAGNFGTSQAGRLGVPDIREQGGSQACFGFGVVQAAHFRRQALGIPSELPSPVVPYFQARRVEVGRDADVTDSGSDPYGMITACADFGACPWDAAPFDERTVNARPSHLALLRAQRLQCTLQPIIETGDAMWTAIRYALAVERKPVLIALEVTDAFRHPVNGIVDSDVGDSYGLHANVLFGLEDGDDGAVSANSWGKSWGSNGVALLTPRFLRSRVVWSGTLDLEEAA